MNKKSILSLVLLFVFSFISFLSHPKQAHANMLDDIFNKVKQVFSPSQQSQIAIIDSITLAPNGDINKNGKIDAGDSIIFFYKITNPTNNSYPFATLKTNINSKLLNSIRNVQGTLNLNNSNGTITIPDIRLHPNQQITISFEATINLDNKANQTISTEPELFDQNNVSIGKGQKQEVTATKTNTDVFNKFVHITK